MDLGPLDYLECLDCLDYLASLLMDLRTNTENATRCIASLLMDLGPKQGGDAADFRAQHPPYLKTDHVDLPPFLCR